jgi:hypothetical protein
MSYMVGINFYEFVNFLVDRSENCGYSVVENYVVIFLIKRVGLCY